MMPLTLLLLAAASLVSAGRPAAARMQITVRSGPTPSPAPGAPPLRRSWIVVGAVALGAVSATVAGPATGLAVGGLTALAGGLVARRAARPAPATDAARLAGAWELLAVCLEAGLPVALAVSAAAQPLDGAAGARLRRVAGLLELGADPADAWRGAADLPALAAFARAAQRSAGTGSALAQVARTEGDRIHAELLDTAQARAQRAAVLITGPLGLCFLPAFLVLGIAPVVVGLAGRALAQW